MEKATATVPQRKPSAPDTTKSTGTESKTMSQNPKYSISILAMNGVEMTQRCIDSVLKHSKNFELLLTDNASDDGTADYFDYLAGAHDNIRVTHNNTNLGFAEPNNEALVHARGKYFVTLNNDTEVPKGWLNLLEKPFLTDPDCAITGPIGSPCSFQHPFPSFHGSLGPNVEYIEGSCLCIPTELARQVGLFANYLHFAYGEDADLSLRMRAREHTIHQVPFKIVHHRSQTTSQVEDIVGIQQRNHIALMKRWGKYLEFRRFDLPFVVRRREAIGDVLLITPLIAELRRQSPASEIYVETNHPELFRDNPAVTKAGVAFPEVYRWATLIDLDMSYENQPETNIVDAYFRTACIMPGLDAHIHPLIYPNRAELTEACEKLGRKKWIAIHPGPTTWSGKNWPWERWEELCRTLLIDGWRVLLIGTPGPSLPNFMDLRGKTNFHQLAAILDSCRLFVGIDSFPLHVAAAMMGADRVVGLFGASDPRYILPPLYREHSVVGTSDCAGARHRVAGQTYVDCSGECMRSITVDMVLEAIKKTTK